MNKILFGVAIATLSGLGLADGRAVADDELLGGDWKRNGLATQRFEIQGTGGRNNPLRRSLAKPYRGNELFVRFRLRYAADSIDTPPIDSGEFFVLWMDTVEGNDGSTHSSGIPNIGIHVSANENRFMVRYGPGSEKFGKPLQGDLEFLVVGRLWKSTPGDNEPFDQLSLWVDPKPSAEFAPDASTNSPKSISEVRWIGFSTGGKTEFEDIIEVWDINLAESWRQILELPAQAAATAQTPRVPLKRTVSFVQHVHPILKAHCFKCHAGAQAKEGVRLDILDEVLNQTAPRAASESRLFQLIADGEMPPEGDKLNTQELTVIRNWIDEGLDWDEQLLPTPVPKSDHWAFQPIRRPNQPQVENQKWIRTAVDAFIARKHHQLGLRPAQETTTQTLQRRVSLGLLGLPVSQQDDDLSIDSLLNNPAYGVRWARHWLDVARWAESNGHQHNRHRPYAWRYRDWVVDALNADKPFDEFLHAQIAGDELQPYSDENVVATGFLSAARYSGNELDKDIQRNDILVDITNTTAQAFLGITLECAQCHTHKFDPISIRDYYRFQAYFADGQPANVVFAGQENAKEFIEERWRIFDSVQTRLVSVKRKQGHPEPIYVIPKTVISSMNPKEKARFSVLEKKIAQLDQAWSYYSPITSGDKLNMAPHEMRWPLPRDRRYRESNKSMLLVRGDVKAPGVEVQAGWPAVFGAGAAVKEKPRTALADWMTDRNNPLTARVWVNRIWQWHFGRGIVETSGDFGTQGSKPTHPELLDYLASELIANDWSTKHIHQLILNSATYRQSSQFSAKNAAIDPDNKFLWRWTPRRLEAEAVRDSILAVSGQLDSTAGGPSAQADSKRRSLYLRQRRDNFPHQQMLFDSAAGIVSCSRRRVSTTALQPLWLMNSKFAQQAADQLAQRSGSVEKAIQLALGRQPTEAEAKTLGELANQYGLGSACLAILNSSEFLYIP